MIFFYRGVPKPKHYSTSWPLCLRSKWKPWKSLLVKVTSAQCFSINSQWCLCWWLFIKHALSTWSCSSHWLYWENSTLIWALRKLLTWCSMINTGQGREQGVMKLLVVQASSVPPNFSPGLWKWVFMTKPLSWTWAPEKILLYSWILLKGQEYHINFCIPLESWPWIPLIRPGALLPSTLLYPQQHALLLARPHQSPDICPDGFPYTHY